MNGDAIKIELEQILIGAVLMWNDAFEGVATVLTLADFSEEIHAQIFDVCSTLIGAGKLASPLTVRQYLPVGWQSGDVTLKEYLARLAAASCLKTEVPTIAAALRRSADQMALRAACQEIMATDGSVDPAEQANWLIEQADAIATANSTSSTPAVTMDQAISRAMDATATAYQDGGKVRGLSYGINALDDKTLGAHPGHLIVIGARTSMGKTALALAVMRNMGHAGHRCMFISLEMGDVDLATRMISDEMWSPHSKMSYWQIASGKYREDKFQGIRDAAERLRGLPIKIEQQPGMTFSQIATRARQYKRRHGLKALFIDHLGLVKPSGRYSGNKVYETGEISAAAKSLAKELGVPVFLLTQLNRGIEGREDKRPNLSDIRSSGDVEQDADTVMLLYRPAYYLEKKEPAPGSAEFIIWETEMGLVHNRLDLIIEKQRAGPVGTTRLFIDIASNAVRDEFSDMGDSLMLPGERMDA
jgi:replicative DNA helicase